MALEQLSDPGNRARSHELALSGRCELRCRDRIAGCVVAASRWRLFEGMGAERHHPVSLNWLKSSLLGISLNRGCYAFNTLSVKYLIAQLQCRGYAAGKE